MDYEYTPLYYSGLTQVKYYDAITDTIRGALCYEDRLVDAQAGWEEPIDYVIKMARKKGIEPDNVIVELDWHDLNEAIL